MNWPRTINIEMDSSYFIDKRLEITYVYIDKQNGTRSGRRAHNVIVDFVITRKYAQTRCTGNDDDSRTDTIFELRRRNRHQEHTRRFLLGVRNDTGTAIASTAAIIAGYRVVREREACLPNARVPTEGYHNASIGPTRNGRNYVRTSDRNRRLGTRAPIRGNRN